MAKPSNKALGKGLTSLFGEETRESMEKAEEIKGYTILELKQIEPNNAQPRKKFEDGALDELAQSIKSHGVLTPISVRKNGEYYQIIAGERRWRASRMAGIEEIPAIVVEADDKLVMELSLIENLQREDLNPVELAKGFKLLMEQYGLTQDEVAERVGKSRSAVANSLRLLGLSEEILSMIINGNISSGHARAILAVNDSEKHKKFAEEIVALQLSVRQAETMAKRLNKAPNEKIEESDDAEINVNYTKELSDKLETSLCRKVTIINGKNKGKIELEYYSDEDLELLCDALSNVRI